MTSREVLVEPERRWYEQIHPPDLSLVMMPPRCVVMVAQSGSLACRSDLHWRSFRWAQCCHSFDIPVSQMTPSSTQIIEFGANAKVQVGVRLCLGNEPSFVYNPLATPCLLLVFDRTTPTHWTSGTTPGYSGRQYLSYSNTCRAGVSRASLSSTPDGDAVSGAELCRRELELGSCFCSDRQA